MRLATEKYGVKTCAFSMSYSANEYYSFGMLMPGRSFSSPSYRFGFNAQLKDDEVYGEGNAMDYKARIENVRLGRFFSVDPKVKTYPFYSTYQFAGNTPIQAIDEDGLEPASVIIPKNGGLPILLPASDHLIRRVTQNERLATASPNYDPNAGGRGLESAGKGLSMTGKVVSFMGCVALCVPGCEPAGPPLIAYGATFSTAGTAVTVADDASQGNWKGALIDGASFVTGKAAGKVVDAVVKDEIKKESTQWLKDEALDITAEQTKKALEKEKVVDEKKDNAATTSFPKIPKPEMPSLPSDKTAVKKPVVTR